MRTLLIPVMLLALMTAACGSSPSREGGSDPGADIGVPSDGDLSDGASSDTALDTTSGSDVVRDGASGEDTALSPSFFVSPLLLQFGTVAVGGSATLGLALSNEGTSTIRVWNLQIEGDASFAIDESMAEGFELEPGTNRNLPVSFNPESGASASAILEIRSNDPAMPVVEVRLFGNGDAPCISVDPAEHDFGALRPRTPREKLFRVTACGDERAGDLVIESIRPRDIDGPGNTEVFVLSSMPTMPLRLGPGETTAFVGQFFGDDLGTYDAVIAIESNDPERPVLRVPIRGTVAFEADCPVPRFECNVVGADGTLTPAARLEPGDLVECDGRLSSGPGGSIASYEWGFSGRPSGSHIEVSPWDDAVTQFRADVAGPLVLQLHVVDSNGLRSCGPAESSFEVIAPGDVYIELSWDGDTDPDTGLGADLDLHLLHPGGCWFDSELDAWSGSPRPSWGHEVPGADDPQHESDSESPFVERIVARSLEGNAIYRIGVSIPDGATTSTRAELRVFLFGTQVYQDSLRIDETTTLLDVAHLSWPSGEVVDGGTPFCE